MRAYAPSVDGDVAPRSHMSGAVGALILTHDPAEKEARYPLVCVRQPEALECDFWLCTCRDEADNDDHYFGPVEKA